MGTRVKGNRFSDRMVGWTVAVNGDEVALYARPTRKKVTAHYGGHTTEDLVPTQPVALALSLDDAKRLHRGLADALADIEQRSKPEPPTPWDIEQAQDVLRRASAVTA